MKCDRRRDPQCGERCGRTSGAYSCRRGLEDDKGRWMDGMEGEDSVKEAGK